MKEALLSLADVKASHHAIATIDGLTVFWQKTHVDIGKAYCTTEALQSWSGVQRP